MTVTIEHDGKYCGPCKYRRRGICYLFGELYQDLPGVDNRHPECMERADPLEDTQ